MHGCTLDTKASGTLPFSIKLSMKKWLRQREMNCLTMFYHSWCSWHSHCLLCCQTYVNISLYTYTFSHAQTYIHAYASLHVCVYGCKHAYYVLEVMVVC